MCLDVKPLEERTCSKRQPKSSIKSARPPSDIEVLRAQVRQIEERRRRGTTALPFGLAEIDARLPAGGLALGALHEVPGGGNGAIDGAAPALFVAGIAARTRGKVLWCLDRPDLFAPALAQADLTSDRSSISTGLGQPTAAATRWWISALPSTPLPLQGVERPRWLVELVRCRAGESADFELEACDDKGHARLPSDPRNRQVQANDGRRRASA